MRAIGAFLASLLAVPATCKYIVPGGRWHDTKGSIINAHGAGITFDQKSGRFWWFGEYKTEDQPEGGGVSVYSSDDLGTWTWERLALGMSLFADIYYLNRGDGILTLGKISSSGCGTSLHIA